MHSFLDKAANNVKYAINCKLSVSATVFDLFVNNFLRRKNNERQCFFVASFLSVLFLLLGQGCSRILSE